MPQFLVQQPLVRHSGLEIRQTMGEYSSLRFGNTRRKGCEGSTRGTWIMVNLSHYLICPNALGEAVDFVLRRIQLRWRLLLWRFGH